jgi:hypothetical protein
MKRKVSTIMEEALFRQVKLEAARQGRPLSAILEEALARYFEQRTARGEPQHRSVADTWGAMAVPSDVLRAIMEDDDADFDA